MARTTQVLIVSLLLAAVTACAGGPRESAGGVARGGALIASLRSEPRIYNRYFEASAAADLVTLLTHARLVRINRSTDELEPALAESWTRSDDGLTYTLKLRPNIAFSDGVPFTSSDVLFSLRAVNEAPRSTLKQGMTAGGQPLIASAPDATTVILEMAAPNPGLRLLDNLPILPRHKLEAAFHAGTMAEAWTPGKPLSEIAGLGPFVLSEHAPGERMVFNRNPHYWRRDGQNVALPYLDRLTVLIIPNQDAEALRLESGATDLMSNGDIRPEDYARFKRLADEGRLRLIDGGVGMDPSLLWFNLAPKGPAERKPWLRRKEFRQALSYAADRQAIANAVYLGAAIPVFGPVTPAMKTWFSSEVPTYPHDPARARTLLQGLGFGDRNNDGLLEDRTGAPIRFSALVQEGHTLRTRTVAMLQEQFRRVGVGLDIVGLDPPSMGQRWQKGEYESILHGWQVSATDPLVTADFWLSSGSSHYWNPAQPKPATPWEERIDDLIARQSRAATLDERKALFLETQRILADEQPILYIVAPKVTLAVSPRVRNEQPAPQVPQLLWSADTLAVSGERR